MRPYAELPNVRNRQIAGDLIAVVVLALAVVGGMRLHDLVAELAEPGRLISDAGRDLADRADAGAQDLAGTPVVGELLSAPLTAVADGGRALRTAGASQQEAVLDVALAIGLGVAVVPILALLVVYVPRRVAAMRRSAAVARLRDAGAGAELLALRALASRPVAELLAVSADPMAAYRRGEHGALAALELRANGLQPAAPPSGSGSATAREAGGPPGSAP